MKQSVELQ